MHKHITMAILIGTLSAIPVVGLAATQAKTAAQAKTPTPATMKHAAASTAAAHSTSGVVRSVDASTLVITRSGKAGGEMKFTLNPSTQREGTIAVGSPVSVRYREEGQMRVATAVRVQQSKQQAAHKPPKK